MESSTRAHPTEPFPVPSRSRPGPVPGKGQPGMGYPGPGGQPMIGYLASHVGTGIPKEDNNYLLCLFCLVPVSSHRRTRDCAGGAWTRNETDVEQDWVGDDKGLPG